MTVPCRLIAAKPIRSLSAAAIRDFSYWTTDKVVGCDDIAAWDAPIERAIWQKEKPRTKAFLLRGSLSFQALLLSRCSIHSHNPPATSAAAPPSSATSRFPSAVPRFGFPAHRVS